MKKDVNKNVHIVIQGYKTLPVQYDDNNKPECKLHKTIKEVSIYKSVYDESIYLIKDPKTNLYSAHERQDGINTDLDKDLEILLKVLYPSINNKI